MTNQYLGRATELARSGISEAEIITQLLKDFKLRHAAVVCDADPYPFQLDAMREAASRAIYCQGKGW